MRHWWKYITLALWVFLFSYLRSVFEVPKNIYFIIGLPLLLAGMFLILYLFEKTNKGEK
ncbi:hypothetical protein [Sporosarcina sp. E16_8]|uniref:hypothetical protein n=1 Tax=Sporosarcina sp. E16_8 TaxID=2789295 RepID=UPI001A9229C5|nr:hypothetical protein [Sporosarcina sp. E16_8]MBO0587635.1 hypothetical protein [Sporosarcina sp. E16_8]